MTRKQRLALRYVKSSLREVASQILVETHSVGGFDFALPAQRECGSRTEFAQPLFVRCVEIEEVLLVQLRHPQRELEERLAGVRHLTHQSRGGSEIDVRDLRRLIGERQ